MFIQSTTTQIIQVHSFSCFNPQSVTKGKLQRAFAWINANCMYGRTWRILAKIDELSIIHVRVQTVHIEAHVCSKLQTCIH